MQKLFSVSKKCFLGVPAVMFLLFQLLPSPVSGQNPDSLFEESSNTVVLLPVVNNNPAMKTGFGAMGMYFFKWIAWKANPLLR